LSHRVLFGTKIYRKFSAVSAPALILICAFVFKGAKTPSFFLPLFLLVIFSFSLEFNAKKTPAPDKFVTTAFLLLLAWLVVDAFRFPPLDHHFFMLSRLFMYAAFALTAYASEDDAVLRAALVFIAALEALYGLLNPHQPGYLGNPLHSSLIITVGWAICLSALPGKSRKEKITYGVLAALFLYSIVALRSRSALAVVVILLILHLRKNKEAAAIAAAGLALLALVFAWKAGGQPLAYLKFHDGDLINSMGRLSIWKSALAGIADKPFFGWGLGNFETAFYAHQFPSHELLRFGRSTIFAHNGFLQIAAEGGLPALGLVVWGFVALLFPARTFLTSKNGEWILSVLLVFFMTSLFNYSLFLPLNGLVFAAVAGRLLKAHRAAPAVGGLSRETLKTCFLFSGVLFGVFLSSYAYSDMRLKQGDAFAAVHAAPYRSDAWYEAALGTLQTPGIEKEAVPLLETALRREPGNAFYWQRLALVLAQYEPSNEQRISEAFARAQRLAPSQTPFYIQEGFYRLMRKETEPAQRLFSMAAELEPNAPLSYYGLGLATNDVRYFAKAKELKETEGKWRTSAHHVQTLSSAYAGFLFSVDTKEIDKLISKHGQ
jgi:O-antigen ligase